MPLVTIADLNDQAEAREKIELAKQLSFLYDEYVNSEEDDSNLREPGIHASEFSSCLRKVTYSLLGYDSKPAIIKFWRQRFKVGHAIHDMIQKDFEKLARRTRGYAYRAAKNRGWIVEFERETKIAGPLQVVAQELNINGHCDGIFTFREHPLGPPILRVGAEIKTESPAEYEKLKEPKTEHVDQAHIYMAALDLPLMWFFYFSKGTQNNTKSEAPYLIPFDPERWAKIEERCQLANGMAKRKELGPRQESIVCQFCGYAWHCQPAFLQPGGKVAHQPTLRVPKVG